MGVVVNGVQNGSVAHNLELIAFVDAAMTVDPAATDKTKQQLINAIGEAGTVDAAAVTAMFQLNTRAADSIGIPLEEPTIKRRSAIGAQLGFNPRAKGLAP